MWLPRRDATSWCTQALLVACLGCASGAAKVTSASLARPPWAPPLADSAIFERLDAVTIGDATAGDVFAPACVARMRAPFHLRPRPDVRSFGPEFPAGTSLEVWGVVSSVRRAEGTPDEAVFANVRDPAGDHFGWAFVRLVELSPTCPLTSDRSLGIPRGAMPSERPGGERTVTRDGFFAQRDRTLVCGWLERDRVRERVDVNGDGALDELLELSQYDKSCVRPIRSASNEFCASLAVRFRTPRGWTAVELSEVWGGSSGGHASHHYVGSIRARRAVYFRFQTEDGSVVGYCRDPPHRVSDSAMTTSLLRVRPSGEGVSEVTLPALLGNGCRWQGLDDESVRIDCARPASSLLLRWDPQQLRLVAEDPTIPEERVSVFVCDP